MGHAKNRANFSNADFFPNNDVAPARRLRICKAQEYGAVWTTKWDGDITHVIVDRGLLFEDVLKFLKLDHFPVGSASVLSKFLAHIPQLNIALVTEDYPSECIKFRSILNTTQSRFRVNAAKTTVNQEDNSASADQASDVSLQLKPPRKRAGASPTPSPNGGNDPAPVAQFPADTVRRGTDTEKRNDSPPTRERDALDDLVDEVKAVEHLVSLFHTFCTVTMLIMI